MGICNRNKNLENSIKVVFYASYEIIHLILLDETEMNCNDNVISMKIYYKVA